MGFVTRRAVLWRGGWLVCWGKGVHGGWSRGVVYGVFGHGGRFCCSAFDMFCSELWFVCWGRGLRDVAVSGLCGEVGEVKGCDRWRREEKMLMLREDGRKEVCGRMQIWISAVFFVSCSLTDLWVSWLD